MIYHQCFVNLTKINNFLKQQFMRHKGEQIEGAEQIDLLKRDGMLVFGGGQGRQPNDSRPGYVSHRRPPKLERMKLFEQAEIKINTVLLNMKCDYL